MKIIAIIGLTLIGTNSSLACSCEEPGSVEEAYNSSDAVFHGKVVHTSFVTFAASIKTESADSIRKSLDQNKLTLFDSEFILKVEFEVIKWYKGNIINDTITIYTTRTSASCGYRGFEVGKDYIVYGSSKSYTFWTFIKNADENTFEQQNTFWTNQCTRTDEYNYAEAKELENLME